jgi:hypothetical protein
MKKTLTALVVLLLAGWSAAWKVTGDRAECELAEARRLALRDEIAANARCAARMASLEIEKQALADAEPAYARILPIREIATDAKLLRTFQGMAERSGVTILSVELVEQRP